MFTILRNLLGINDFRLHLSVGLSLMLGCCIDIVAHTQVLLVYIISYCWHCYHTELPRVLMCRVQTPGYIPKKTRWVFGVHPP